MDTDLKLFLGKILGEVYRLQKKQDMCYVGDAKIFGLLNGIETVVDDEIETIGHIKKEQMRAVIDVLNEIYKDEEKTEKFSGYYDIEHELEKKGINRYTAIQILKYLYANHQFTNLIDKMDSSNSPSECRDFDLDDWDK